MMPESWKDYKFSWNKDLYSKKVFVKKKGEKKIPFDPENPDKNLPADIVSALKQIANGAKVFRGADEATPELFVKKHNITDFTDELNKKLAQDYGIGFASSIYQYLLQQKPENIQVAKVVHEALAKGPHQASENVTFIIARGYAHSVMGNDLFKYLKEDLTQMGYEVITAETESFGKLEQNEKIMLNLFEEQMKLGKKIVLVGTCVGLVASLGALEEIRSRTGREPLAGLINIAGMLKGSFTADWGTRMPQWFFIKRGLFKEYKQKGGAPDNLHDLDAMKDFRFERISSFLSKVGKAGHFAPKALNLVSILPGNGLGRERSGIRRMQDQVIRPNIKRGSYGANDGIIEYPGTVLSDKLSAKNMSLVFESSHNFLDGYFDSFGKRFDLRNDEERRLIFGSVIQSFLEL